MKLPLRVLALVSLLLIALATRAIPGTTGMISGYLTWLGSGRAISDVYIWVCSPSDIAVMRTNARGFYSFISLAPGRYSMFFVAPTHIVYSIPAIGVTADQTTMQNPSVCPDGALCDTFGQGPLQAKSSSSVWNIDSDPPALLRPASFNDIRQPCDGVLR